MTRSENSFRRLTRLLNILQSYIETMKFLMGRHDGTGTSDVDSLKAPIYDLDSATTTSRFKVLSPCAWNCVNYERQLR
jgi:hypothetical protein